MKIELDLEQVMIGVGLAVGYLGQRGGKRRKRKTKKKKNESQTQENKGGQKKAPSKPRL